MARTRRGARGETAHAPEHGASHRRLAPDVRSLLISWYEGARRDLPWRRTKDPYAIWVSEIMLQQTQVDTVLPYYARFMRRFPDVASLACADEEEVLSLWSGLGYYRRGRALLAGARAVVERHAGRVPRDPAALADLPGIGRYTAGAIASIAFELAEPILDGNVRRVLSRLLAVNGARLGRAREDRLLWSVAAELARGPRPGDLNQALMELGALVCTPRDPACEECPVRSSCVALDRGTPGAFPSPRPRAPGVKVHVGVPVVTRGRAVLLERPGPDSPFRGSWDLPSLELGPGVDERVEIARVIAQRHGIEINAGRNLGSASHGIMNRRLKIEAFACSLRRGRIAQKEGLRWLDLANLDSTPVSGATRKILALK